LGSSLFLYGCNDDDESNRTPAPVDVFDLGSGDVGILNYAYALEQLNRSGFFYTQVILRDHILLTQMLKEKLILQDIYDRGYSREFLRLPLQAWVVICLGITRNRI
jgi:hypothetical protein